jgi:pumilio family protein 6
VTHTFPIVEESDSEDVDEGGDADVAVDDEPPTDENAMEVETEINQQKDPNGMLHL